MIHLLCLFKMALNLGFKFIPLQEIALFFIVETTLKIFLFIVKKRRVKLLSAINI